MLSACTSWLLFALLSLSLWQGHGLAFPLASVGEAPASPPARDFSRRALQQDRRLSGPRSALLKRAPPDSSPKYVFRGVKADMPPAFVKEKGGMFPHNDDPKSLTADAYRVLYHQKDEKNEHGKNSAYASTSSAFEVAAFFAQRGGYIYVIKSTPNMFPVASTVDKNSLPWEREYTALGGIRFEQIAECYYLPPDADLEIPKTPQWKLETHDDVSQNMQVLRDLVDKGVLQPRNDGLSYDESYDLQSASPGQPQLAGYIPGDAALDSDRFRHVDPEKPTWRYAKEFMDSIGAGQGWSARFPLFQNPVHVAAIEQDEQEARRTSQDGATTDESSLGADVVDLLYELSPAKPFGDLIQALRSDVSVPIEEWLTILGFIGLEILTLIPNPASLLKHGFEFARAGYLTSQALKQGVKAAQSAARAAEQSSQIAKSVERAVRISTKLDTKLSALSVEVPSSAARPVQQPVSRITKIADKIKVDKPSPARQGEPSTSTLSPQALDDILKQLEDIKVPDEPVVPVMMQVVKEAGKKAKKPVAALAERSSEGTGQSLADALQRFIAAKRADERVSLEALDSLARKVGEKLGRALGEHEEYKSFLETDELWLMLGTKLSEAAQQ